MLRVAKTILNKKKLVKFISLNEIETLEQQLQAFIIHKDSSRKSALKQQIDIILNNHSAVDQDSIRVKKIASWIKDILNQLSAKESQLKK